MVGEDHQTSKDVTDVLCEHNICCAIVLFEARNLSRIGVRNMAHWVCAHLSEVSYGYVISDQLVVTYERAQGAF